MILYQNGTEHLVLWVSFWGHADEYAWVIQVPEEPDIGVWHSDLFWKLWDFTEPAIEWPSCLCGFYAASEDVEDVTEEQVVGPYATAVLSASDPTALVDRLNANGEQ